MKSTRITERWAKSQAVGENGVMTDFSAAHHEYQQSAPPIVPPAAERQLPAKSQETTPQNPWPLALLAQNMKNYIDKVPQLWVEAQVASLNGRGGNVFIELKDLQEDFSFTLALFGQAGRGLGSDVKVGARVVTLAKPSLWKNGRLSLIGRRIYAVGTGNLHEQLQILREKLAAEGLFADAHKKPLPLLPHRVGLITGRDSDAEKDVIRNASLRWPGVQFEVRNVKVQGEGSASEVMAALSELDAHPEVDVIVIARGGGSFEDLLSFSDEALVRAVAAAQTPVVSAIGHEADSPILDAVADVRASTPTDAGKRIVPDVAEELAVIREARARADRAVLGYLNYQAETDLGGRSEEIFRLRERAARSVEYRVARERDAISHTIARVRALSPMETLKRGYTIVQRADGELVRDATTLSAHDKLTMRAAVGGAEVSVVKTYDSNLDL